MANYYNVISSAYLTALKSSSTIYRTMIQPLDEYEQPIGEIYADLLMSEPPRIDIGSNNGIRRTCTLSLWNYDEKYSPSKNSFVWYRRKFRVLEGVISGDAAYWQSMGVFCCRSAVESNGILQLTGIDKYGMLNGELNYGRSTAALTTDIASGDIYVAELIRETLTAISAGGVLDCVSPMIEQFFEAQKLYADISLGAGQPYGAVLTALLSMYGADCYYDRNGILRFVRRPDYNIPSWYAHTGVVWTFDEADVNILDNYSKSTEFSAVNTVTVSSDNTDGEITTVTVRNDDPACPISVPNIGEQLNSEATVYISIGDTTLDTAENKCREYGAYLLTQNAKQACSISFVTALIPHLDVGDLINCKGEDMLITAISADLDAKTMQISAVNVVQIPRIEVSA